MQKIINQYQELLKDLDRWFAESMEHAGEQIACHQGCSGCCRGLFEISLLDACLLQQGFKLLETEKQAQILDKARNRLNALQLIWPEFQHPFILNRLPHNDWQEMPEEDETPCPLLADDGLCLVYAHRPMTCRLHGLPNIDTSGESFSDDYCSLNFTACNPLLLTELRYPFRATFNSEFALLGSLAKKLLGRGTLELDTFVPSALLIDFSEKSWRD